MTTYRLVPVEPSEETIDELAKRLVRLINADPSSWGIYKIATRRFYEYVLASAPDPSKQSELLEAAKMAREALASCYNVIEYPANGKTSQDRAIALLDTAIRNYEQGGECAHE